MVLSPLNDLDKYINIFTWRIKNTLQNKIKKLTVGKLRKVPCIARYFFAVNQSNNYIESMRILTGLNLLMAEIRCS